MLPPASHRQQTAEIGMSHAGHLEHMGMLGLQAKSRHIGSQELPSMIDCTPQPSRAPHDIDSPTNVYSSALTVNETQETDSIHQVPPLPGMEGVEAGG